MPALLTKFISPTNNGLQLTGSDDTNQITKERVFILPARLMDLLTQVYF